MMHSIYSSLTYFKDDPHSVMRGNFKHYHRKISKTFSPLPPVRGFKELVGVLKEIAIRITLLASTFLVYPILASAVLLSFCHRKMFGINQTKLEEQARSAALEPAPLVKESKEEKDAWVEAVKKVKACYLENPQEEVERLRAAGILDSRTEANIDNGLLLFGGSDTDSVKMVIGRAIELKKIFAKKYYVFFHAQSSQWTGLTYLVKQLAKTFYPDKDLRLFKYLRNPDVTQAQSPASTSFDQPSGLERFMEDFINHSTDSALDHQPHLVKSLVCADTCDPAVTVENGESSFCFLSRDVSVASYGNMGMIKKVMGGVLSEFIPDSIRRTVLEPLTEVASSVVKSKPKCGNLYVICIPKALIKNPDTNVLWRSHPYGIPCKCHPKAEDILILEKLQRNVVNKSTLCSFTTSSSQMPQVRILTKELVPEKDVKIMFISPNSKAERDEMKTKTKNVVQFAAEILEESVRQQSPIRV